jgi:hypothetical protein
MDTESFIPPEDGAGRVILTETKVNTVNEAVVICIVAGLAICSVIEIYGARNGGSTVYLYPAVAWLLFSLPALPWLTAMLLFPRRLIVDDGGLILTTAGLHNRLAWAHVQSIAVRKVVYSRTGGIDTFVDVLGYGKKLRLPAVFGLSPSALAEYLATRHNRANPHLPAIAPVYDSAPLERQLRARRRTIAIGAAVALLVILADVLLAVFNR